MFIIRPHCHSNNALPFTNNHLLVGRKRDYLCAKMLIHKQFWPLKSFPLMPTDCLMHICPRNLSPRAVILALCSDGEVFLVSIPNIFFKVLHKPLYYDVMGQFCQYRFLKTDALLVAATVRIARVTLTPGMIIYRKVSRGKWLEEREIEDNSEVFWYQMTAKRLHFRHISSYIMILCYLTEDNVLKICNFAEICRKMPFACCHGNMNCPTRCFVWNRYRLWSSTLPESFKGVGRLFWMLYTTKSCPRLFRDGNNISWKFSSNAPW